MSMSAKIRSISKDTSPDFFLSIELVEQLYRFFENYEIRLHVSFENELLV